MSRTDVHRPPRVQEKDPYLQGDYVDVHRHEGGSCDLSEYLESDGGGETDCYRAYVGWRNTYCGCRMCTAQFHRKLHQRRIRAHWRMGLRRMMTALPEDRDTVDVHPLHWTW